MRRRGRRQSIMAARTLTLVPRNPETKRARAYFIGFYLSLVMSFVGAFVVPGTFNSAKQKQSTSERYLSSSGNGDEDDEEINLADKDWRAFRAKLVMGEPSPPKESPDALPDSDKAKSDDGSINDGDLDGIGALYTSDDSTQLRNEMTPLDKSQWAYDSGSVIEQGAVILGGVEQDYGFGLRQQYFHKAAILVLDHQESTFTKGIILNRPSDLLLEDEINDGVKWRVWFGGDVQGIDSASKDIVCLHTLQTDIVKKASIPVMNDIQWTTFDVAKKLVKAGAANPTDFWVFCGYAGWGPGQLMGELERKSWYMVATDSQTLLKELARQVAGADPREAGLDTWSLLMSMIGRSRVAKENTGAFDDLMLKEWALKNLLSIAAGGGAEMEHKAKEGMASTQELKTLSSVDRLIQRVSASSRGENVQEGTIVRASSAERSPFLLESQDLHKSIVLVVTENDQMTIGVVLNRPGAKGLEVKVQEKGGGNSRQLRVPLRYGGQYSVKGNEPLMWLHCSPLLREANIGTPVGMNNGVWKCTSSDMMSAVGQALATPEEFLVVSGVSVWTKGEKGRARGMQGEIRAGHFEIVPESKTSVVWDIVLKQEVLTDETLTKNLGIGNEAWQRASCDTKKKSEISSTPIGGLGEGFDEEDDSLVFKSDTKVSKLSDDALRSWVATFLLGSPSLAE